LSENDVALYVGFGTVIGSFIGIFFSSLLGRAQKISTFRQDWINSLRNVFADILLQAEVFTDVAYKDDEEAYREKVKLLNAIYKTKVFLNLNEAPSERLVEIIEQMPDEYIGKSGGSRAYKDSRNVIEELMRDILKEEWNRVRDGEVRWKVKKYLSKRFKKEPVSYHELKILLILLVGIVIAVVFLGAISSV